MDVAAQSGDNLARCGKVAGQLEWGLRVARIDTLIKLASSLEISAAELLAGIRWDLGSVRTGKFSGGDR